MLLNSSIGKFNYVSTVCHCTRFRSHSKFSKSILLPKTSFPLKIKINSKNPDARDKEVYISAGFEKLYDWQRGHLSEPEFVLHDGPPYANGQPHMGHAMNKILKDTILRHNILKGNKVHYVPGWDCHGLPIELKALNDSQFQKDPIEIRKTARDFAKNTVENQMRIFKSWGILGDWKNVYTTYSPDYMKLQFRQFFKLYMKNLIYRDVKPVYWSPSSRTALAEAELEYNEKHKSPSVYVKLKVKHTPKLANLNIQNLYAIIWTTTPWTLPSNQAVCFNKSLSYSIVKPLEQNDIYIVATDLVQDLSNILKTKLESIQVIPGDALEGIIYEHPVYKNKNHSFISSAHVSSSKGTGLVHTAGAHGPDDFLVCLKNKMKIVDLIDDRGHFIAEAGESLNDKYALTDGNTIVLELINENVLHKETLIHSYPYDWRTKKPVIIKASKQWFINTEMIKNRAVEVLENVNILPADKSDIYKSNLIKQIQKRPYWCISRQRKWGVPIPILYHKTSSENIINENTINTYCKLVDEVGTDFWWKVSNKELLCDNTSINADDVEKCEDIMDIWLDSGLSWSKVLEGSKVADMYLEGIDQFTGWFQSSLLTSVALRDKAPYKTIYVHGFAVDEKGMKMSKSLGNVVDPVVITNGDNGKNAYGIDTLRWWVTCHANQQALASVSKNVLDSSAEEVQKIRSVLRFALGSLNDYEITDIDTSTLVLIDRYMLHLLYQFHNKVSECMDCYQYQKVSNAVIHFLTNAVSAFYYTAIKDRLYCDMEYSHNRRSAQHTLYYLLEIVSLSVAPILPHLVEELYSHFQKGNKAFFMSEHVKPTKDWQNERIEKLFEVILGCKKEINKNGGTNKTVADIVFSKDTINNLIEPLITTKKLEEELEDIFQVSKVNIIENDITEPYKITLSNSKQYSCPRCRKINSDDENSVCRRCYEVFNHFTSKTVFVMS